MSMLVELSMALKPQRDDKIGYLQSSLFQGVLMESINKDYAETIHQNGLHPYSQCIYNRDGLVWSVRTVNDDAYHGIIEPLLSPSFRTFELKQRELAVEIVNKTVKSISYEDLMKTFNSDDVDRYVKVLFDSPTAFKSDSNYVFMPDIKLIFGSLMRKYSSASSSTDMSDDDTLEYIATHTSFSDYKIRSVRFPLENTRIPAFMGEVTLHFRGTDTMARYAKMLLEFGEYSGIGIKCGMGMGSIKIEREGR